MINNNDLVEGKNKLKSTTNASPGNNQTLFGRIGAFFSAPFYSLVYYFRPRTALMELASGINEEKMSQELEERIKRVNYLKSIARPPLTPEEELSKLDTTPSPRFCVNDPELLKYLDEYGYVVVNLEASETVLDEIKDSLWEFLETNFPGWKRGHPDTWESNTVPGRVWGADKGIIFGAGIGQSEFLWRLRTLKGVKETFAKVWGDDDVITSFDGANIFRPWNTQEEANGGANRADRKTDGGWWHVDQGRAKSGKKCAVQGLVSMFRADASTGGLCVMPKTQARHAEVVQDTLSPNDYVPVQPYFPGYDTLERRLVCCEAGDLILWDSRTIHCNTPAPKPDLLFHEPKELLRAVGYVCMTPRSFAPRDVLELRREGYSYGVTTSHWPHEYKGGTAGDPSVVFDIEKCPEDRRQLIG
jgi:hypothetical protein